MADRKKERKTEMEISQLDRARMDTARSLARQTRQILAEFRQEMLDILEENDLAHLIEETFWKFYAPEDQDLRTADHYAEPGMDDPADGKTIIIASQWDNWPRHLDTALEQLGYMIEWSDTATACQECGGIVITSPSSMAWRPYYVWYQEPGAYYSAETEFLCLECAQANIDQTCEDAQENARGEMPDEHTAREMAADLDRYANDPESIPEDGIDRGLYHIIRDWQDMDNVIASYLIGSVLHLAPSGKYYTPFACGNVDKCPQCDGRGEIGPEYSAETCPLCDGHTSLDARADRAFYDALDTAADVLDGGITSGEGDPCDLFFQIYQETNA